MNTTTQLRNQCSASYLTSSITTRAQVERTYEEMERASRAMNAARGRAFRGAVIDCTSRTMRQSVRIRRLQTQRGRSSLNLGAGNGPIDGSPLANSRAKNYARDI